MPSGVILIRANVMHMIWMGTFVIFTLRACTRGKVIGSVVIVVVVVVVIVHTKIARSRDIGILASGQCCQDVIIKWQKGDESFLLSA